MGMSGWIMELEDVFEESVEKIVSESECIEEAYDRSISVAKPLVPHLSQDDISDIVGNIWNEYWSKYQ